MAEGNKQGALANVNSVPRTEGERTMHVGVTYGEVSNRIITVGDPRRAQILRQFLDPDQEIIEVVSKRGFTTYTGKYNGVEVSIIAIGMGFAMMDFLVRETRNIVQGPMVFIRYGTTGALRSEDGVGKIAIASEGSISVTRNSDSFDDDEEDHPPPYRISRPVQCDVVLAQTLERSMIEQLGRDRVVTGLNVSADSFYSSQGRSDPNFDDRNENMINHVTEKYPSAVNMEMETFHLFDLARSSFGTIRACAAAMLIVNRPTNQSLSNDEVEWLESEGGQAVLKAITSFQL